MRTCRGSFESDDPQRRFTVVADPTSGLHGGTREAGYDVTLTSFARGRFATEAFQQP